jgi:hypothetical protein
MSSKETEQPRKISKSEQAQIDYDAEVSRRLVEDETAKKKRQDELDIASFMEAKRLNKLETTAPNPVSTVPPTVLREKAPMFTYVPTEEELNT